MKRELLDAGMAYAAVAGFTGREGNTLLQPDHGYNVNVAGFYLHAPVHKARPEVSCIMHTHTRAGTAVTALWPSEIR